MKTVEQLSIADLTCVAEETSVPVIIWGEEIILSGIYFYKDNREIAPLFDKIKELLFWFDKSKIEITQSISDKFIRIAQDWKKENGVQDTISSDDFCNSVEIIEIGFCIGDIEDEPEINIYIGCDEIFSDHTICCYLKEENGKIICNFALEG